MHEYNLSDQRNFITEVTYKQTLKYKWGARSVGHGELSALREGKIEIRTT